MTAKQYLSQAQFYKGMIRRTEEQLEEIRSRAMSATGVKYDKLNIQNSPSNDTLTSYVIQLEKAESKVQGLITEYYAIYSTIQTQITLIQPEIYREILALRYLDGFRLNQIAIRLGYADGYIRKVHGRALQAFYRKFLKEGTQRNI